MTRRARLMLAVLGLVVVTGLLLGGSPAAALTLRDPMHSAISRGNKLYDKGEPDKALEQYRRAATLDSLATIPQFNAGDALYKMGKYKEGAAEFLKSASASSDSVASMSYYNLGNTAFKSGDYRSAADAYKRSLLMNPDDRDAKFNLEYAMRMLQQQQQQQQQNQQNQQNQQQEKNQDQAKNQQQQQQQQPNQEQQEQQQQQAQASESQGGEQQQPQGGQGEMTPDELKRILAAIDASDRETQQELLRKAGRTKHLTEKDW